MKYQKKRVLKRRPKRRINRKRVPKLPRSKLHFFKRNGYITNGMMATVTGGGNGQSIVNSSDALILSTGAGGVSSFTYYSFAGLFTLDQLPNYTELTSLFDNYKICGIKIRVIPFATTNEPSTSTLNSASVLIHSITDTNDAVLITASGSGVQMMRERETYKVQNAFNVGGKGYALNRYCKPGVAISTYGTAGSDFSIMKNRWISSGSEDVQHYAFKWMIEVFNATPGTNLNLYFKTEATYYIQCKDVV